MQPGPAGDVLVRGGQFFPKFTPSQLSAVLRVAPS
jgi:hypothetical protein